MAVGETIAVTDAPCVLALDGEREVEIPKGGTASVRLSMDGPVVIDPRRTMTAAQQQGVFVASRTIPMP